MAQPSSSSPYKHLGVSRVSPWLMGILYPFGRWFLRQYFGEITISGNTDLPLTDPIIFAPTHRSRWDAILLALAVGRGVTGRDLRFMVTDAEVQGIQGWFIRRLGGFPVNIRRADFGSLSYSVGLLQQGEMLVVFPEGGIFRDSQVYPLKRGIGRIALQAMQEDNALAIKVFPVAIHYGEPYPKRGTKINLVVGSGINVAEFNQNQPKQDSRALTQALQSELTTLYTQTVSATTSANPPLAIVGKP